MRHRDSSSHFEYIMPLESQPMAKFVYKVPKNRNPNDDFIATYSFGKTDARTPNDTQFWEIVKNRDGFKFE